MSTPPTPTAGPLVVLLFDPIHPEQPNKARVYYDGGVAGSEPRAVANSLFYDLLTGDGLVPTGLLCTPTGQHVLDRFLQELFRTPEAFAIRDVRKRGQRYTYDGRATLRTAWDRFQVLWGDYLDAAAGDAAVAQEKS